MGALFFAYSLISARLAGTVLTAPLLFVAVGYLVGPAGAAIATIDVNYSTIHVIAEFTLVVVLFSDAARINLGRVRRDHGLPERMLLYGLPLTIIAGAVAALVLFPGFSIWEAALLAALLAPTDAAVGQAVVTASAVPLRIRQAINIESGLNDGIALPAVLLFAALAGAAQLAGQANDWARFAVMQVTVGPLVGAVLGLNSLGVTASYPPSSPAWHSATACAIPATTCSSSWTAKASCSCC